MPEDLRAVRVWLSGSVPREGGPDAANIKAFIRAFAKEMFRRGGHVLHGSHPTVRQHLLDEAKAYQAATDRRPSLTLVTSQLYAKNPDENGVDLQAWDELSDEKTIVTREGAGKTKQEIKDASLSILRETLLAQSNVMVAFGGKWWDVAANVAGVPKEAQLAEGAQLPVFLLGSLGGATRSYLEEHPELWQRCRNGLTEQQNRELVAIADYAELAKRIVDQIARLPVRYRSPDAGRPFRILCLDGGGIRGVYTAAVLATWERLLGCRVVDHFDLIAGTSTGGILAIGLGLGLPAQALLDFYRNDGPDIFGGESESGRSWRSLRHWFGSKFDQRVLKGRLEKAYQQGYGQGTSLDASSCRLVITSYDSNADIPLVFKTSHGQAPPNGLAYQPVDVALATSAAPTYFDPVPTQNVVAQVLGIDGGVWANQPCSIAVAEAVSVLGIPVERLDVLSIGTTFFPSVTAQPLVIDAQMVGKLVSITGGFWASLAAKVLWKNVQVRGKLGWAANIAELLMKTQSQATDRLCKGLLGKDRYLRIDGPSSHAELDDIGGIEELQSLGQAAGEESLRDVQRRFLNGVPAAAWPKPGAA